MMPVSSGMRFDTENSRCIPAERMTPDELRQLHRLAIERRPEACLGCGLAAAYTAGLCAGKAAAHLDEDDESKIYMDHTHGGED